MLSIFLYFCYQFLKIRKNLKMKKIVVILAIAISIVSCNNSSKPAAEVKGVIPASVVPSGLIKEYKKKKNIENKYNT